MSHDHDTGFNGRYILNDAGEPILCKDLSRWAQWMDRKDNRIIAKTVIEEEYAVSTVFLGLDHGMSWDRVSGKELRPILYETMIFGPDLQDRPSDDCDSLDGMARRYCTAEEAREGHLEVCGELKSYLGILS